MPAILRPPASTSFGHLTRTSACGAKARQHVGQAAKAATKESCAHSPGGLVGPQQQRGGEIAGRRFPRPAPAAAAGGLARGGDPERAASPAAARRRASSLVESISSNSTAAHNRWPGHALTGTAPARQYRRQRSAAQAAKTNSIVNSAGEPTGSRPCRGRCHGRRLRAGSSKYIILTMRR